MHSEMVTSYLDSFLQNTGKTNVKLKIGVNLRTITVTAKGKFFIKKANIKYLGHNFKVSNAHINLNNYDVKIKNMQIKYKEIANTKINVKYDAKSSKKKK